MGPAVPGSAQFTVASWQQGPAGAIANRAITHVASLGSRVFAAVRKPNYHWALQEWDLSSGAWAQLGTEFGPGADTDFFGHTIDTMRVFEAVPTGGGGQENLLLITTTPGYGDWDQNYQGVLWGYSVCAAGAPQLRFAVSIGVGDSAYTPTLDRWTRPTASSAWRD